MGMIVNVLFISIMCYCSYKWGQAMQRAAIGDASIGAMLAKAKFPVGVAEKIEGHYYLYEKDTTNFLCQAPSLEELPQKLLENKRISLAIMMCPEESSNQVYWCINGKLKTVKN